MATALIIEDDLDNNDLLAELVSALGFTPLQCFTGESGLAMAQGGGIDLIFLDLMLPDVDGYKVCERLKLDRHTNPLPIIMVSALSESENQLRGFRVGADVYVTKPYTPEDIAEAIRAAQEHRERLEGDQVEHFVRIDLTSEESNLHSVNEILGILLLHTPLSEKDVGHLRTCLQEIGHNAIEWGNKHDPEKMVTITCHLCPDRVEFRVADEGEGFDPTNLPHACDGGEDPTKHMFVREMMGIREGGFGILIARGLLDQVVYNQPGNAVTLVKRFTSTGSE